jgi:hypothetical protein
VTAKRAKVASTTKPSISDSQSNRPVGGDITPGVGSQRKGKNFAHGATPGTKTPNGQYYSSSVVDQQNLNEKPC